MSSAVNAADSRSVAISVVVPSYNDATALARCLHALQGQKVSDGGFEVIVVDNGSEPPIEDPGLDNTRVIRESRPGSYSARNAGVAAARGQIIAFTDADCQPNTEWLAGYARWFAEHPGSSMAAGPIVVVPENPSHRTPAEIHEAVHAFPQENYISQRRFAATANLAVRVTVFNQVGGFDATLRSGGDVEFGMRASEAGFDISYVPDASVQHASRARLGDLIAKQRRTMAGTRDLAERRGEPPPFQSRPVVRRFLPPVRSVLRALRNDHIGSFRDRVLYSYALMCLHYSREVTRTALARGASSPR